MREKIVLEKSVPFHPQKYQNASFLLQKIKEMYQETNFNSLAREYYYLTDLGFSFQGDVLKIKMYFYANQEKH